MSNGGHCTKLVVQTQVGSPEDDGKKKRVGCYRGGKVKNITKALYVIYKLLKLVIYYKRVARI
jgi:hypothetical protein